MTSAVLQCLVRELRQTAAVGSDAELLERFRRAGDPEAFEAIVRRHGAAVLAACRNVLPSHADAEDAFQATFVVLLRSAPAIRKGQALSGWLCGVAHRVALKALTASLRRQRAERSTPARPGDAPDPSWREACAVLHEELDGLADEYRLPLMLCYLHGKTRDEAARQLGVSKVALHGRLERGRKRLRSCLRKRGITLSAGLLAVVANSVPAGGPPETLVRTTLEAAATGKIPAKVAALLHGATPSMTLGKVTLFSLLLVVGLLASGVGLKMRAGEPPATTRTNEAPPGDERKPVAVSGKVVGPDGKPVPNAKLFVFDSEECKAAPRAQSSADGTFEFELPALAGTRSYRYLVATAPDLGMGCDWVGVAAANEPLRDAVLKLPKDEPVRGRVVDLEGKPVAGARVRVTDLYTGKDSTIGEFVRLWSGDYESQQRAMATLHGRRLYAKKATAEYFAATTNEKGEFTLAGVGRDRCPHLSVSANGCASVVCVVPIRAEFKPAPGGFTGSPVVGPEFTLPMSPAKPISGVVRDAEGKPLPGTRVAGCSELSDTFRSGWLILPDVETVTDAQGRYTLDGLRKGKKYVLVAAPKAGDGSIHQFVQKEDDGPGFAPLRADFDLPRGVVLTGRITDKRTGEPVRGHVFHRPLWSNKWVEKNPGFDSRGLAPWASEWEAWTDADGKFKLTVTPDTGILHIQVLDHDTGREYALAKLAPEDDNEEVVHKGIPEMKLFKTTGQGGMFGPANLNAYRVLRIPADAKAFTADVTVDPGVTRVVKLVDPDGKPVTGAWVLNDRVYGGKGEPHTTSEVTVFALASDQPRWLYAQHDTRKLAGMIALDGKDSSAAVLKLEPMATVTGRLVDRDGAPIKEARLTRSYSDAEVGIILNTRERHDASPVVTDADGRFTLSNIPAGLAVRLGAQKKGGGYLDHEVPERKFKPGETLSLGDWKPK